MQAESDSALRITSACYGCGVGDAQEGIQRWDTSDGGTTFVAEPSLGGTPTNAGMGPDGITLASGVYVTPADGDQIIARPGTPDTVAVDAASGTNFVQTPSIVQIPGQNRLVYASSDLFGIRTAIYNGPDSRRDVADGRGALDDRPAAPDARVGGARAAPDRRSGRRVAHLRAEDPARRPRARAQVRRGRQQLRRAALARVDRRHGDATIDGVSSSQDASGRVHVVWQTHLTTSVLRYTRSDAGGGTFAAPGTLATGAEDYEHPYVATGPDAAGWIAWQGNGDSPIRVMRLEASALGDATDSSVTSSSATTTRTAKVSGATLSFRVPAGCVKRGAGFSVRLTWKKQKKKGNLFVKVSRADFYVGTKRSKIDRKAPFTQTLRIPTSAKPGSTRQRARAGVHQGQEGQAAEEVDQGDDQGLHLKRLPFRAWPPPRMSG